MRRLLPILLLVLLASCSPPSFVAQRYHNFTAYYNTFYNAERAFERGIASLEASTEPIDRDRYLPVFVPPDRVGGGQDFSLTIQKSADILRNHAESKWVDDALLLIGKSYFYQQNYVGAAQKFREAIALESDLEGEARFWLARSLIQAGNDEAAAEHLRASLDNGASHGAWTAMMQLARGELLVRQGQWQEAAIALERGLEGGADDRAAARAAFLLGQVRETIGAYSAAARAYEVVNEDYQPRYELSYAARVSALRVRGLYGDTEAALERLRRMERDDKNFEKRAELALLRGRLYRAMGRPDDARATYRALLYDDETRSPRPLQGRVHYALAALYQEAYNDFSAAAAHFDTAATALDRPRIASAEVLGAAPAAITDSRSRADLYRTLADKSTLVSRLDSLLRLGALPDDAFQAAIAAVRARRAAEEEQARRAAARRRDAQRFGGSDPRIQREPTMQQQQMAGAGGEEAGFLFHQNPVRAQEARRNFERRWGARPLVPNWRRLDAINAQGGASQAADDTTDPAVVQANDGARPQSASVRVDISAVPRDSASQAEMRAQRAVARYEFANALFLAAGRADSAATWYQRVIEADADQPVARRALYALAEVRQAQGDSAAARRLYQRIIDRYPQSPFAERARDRLGRASAPRQTDSDALAAAETAYAHAYTRWEADDLDEAVPQFVDAAVQYAETPVAAKALWAALTIALRQNADTPRTLDMPLPPPFERLVPGSDSTTADSVATLQASRIPVADPPVADSSVTALPTLGDVLDHLIAHYPDTPHAQRAVSLRAALSEQAAAARDSVRIADSTRADTAATDSIRGLADPAQADLAQADSAQAAPAAARIDGWGIIIATRASRTVAERLQQVYAPRVPVEGVSILIRPVEEDGTTRYQIVAAPFASQEAAASVREQLRNRLPGQARVERLRE